MLLIVLVLSSPVNAADMIQIKGWSRMVPIIKDAAADFRNVHPNVTFTISEEENPRAKRELYDGTIDIALSRNVTDLSHNDRSINYSKFVKYPIGRSAVIIIVNQANPVTNLSPLQIQRIYMGEIKKGKVPFQPLTFLQ